MAPLFSLSSTSLDDDDDGAVSKKFAIQSKKEGGQRGKGRLLSGRHTHKREKEEGYEGAEKRRRGRGWEEINSLNLPFHLLQTAWRGGMVLNKLQNINHIHSWGY